MADNIKKIAQEAVLATEGVSGISFPGVLPIPKDKSLVFEVYITVKYGVSIPEVAWALQDNVKKKLSSFSISNVDRINVHVEGIDF